MKRMEDGNILDLYIQRRSQVKITASIFYKSLYDNNVRSTAITRENACFVFGEDMESVARKRIAETYGFSIGDVGSFFQRNALGAKVDGIINKKEYVLEIKCVSTQHFYERIRVCDAYQLWIGCYCAGIDKGTLCYWHPVFGIKRYDTVFPRTWWERCVMPHIKSMLERPNKRKRDMVRSMIDKKIVHCYTRVVDSPHFVGKVPIQSPLLRMSKRMRTRRKRIQG